MTMEPRQSDSAPLSCAGCGAPLYKGPGAPWGPRVFCNTDGCPDSRGGKPLPPNMLPRRAVAADLGAK
jgi:hypothetical protein